MFHTLAARTLVLRHTAVAALRGRSGSLASTRAVTFIEYALLAGIAVLVATIFRSQLSATFSTLLERFHTASTL